MAHRLLPARFDRLHCWLQIEFRASTHPTFRGNLETGADNHGIGIRSRAIVRSYYIH